MRRIGLCGLLCLLATAAHGDAPAARHFREKVAPLLESRCVACHGPDDRSGGLRLDTRESLLKGGEHGPAAVPGDPAKSRLLAAVRDPDAERAMPPKERLSWEEIDALERWVRDGAPWPAADGAPGEDAGGRIGDAWTDPRNPIARHFGGERLGLWSFKPARRVEPPSVRDAAWARNPIDRFVLARLEAHGRTPPPEADRRTLVRRVAFDLTGLPPTPEAVDRFLSDERPDAYERLVDELLASPAHGEHAARAWLDVVRYADSNGFDWDEYRPKAWRYRDYVVRSFDADKPFDRFVVEQLAGDELVDGPPRTDADRDALIATGYLRMGPQDNAASLFDEQPRARAELMADLVETTGGAMLGLTLSCCRCHDHKTDPLSQADHFRLRAFFEPVAYADDLPLDLADEQEAIRRHNAPIDAEAEGLKKERDAPTASGPAGGERREAIEAALRGLDARRRRFETGLLMTDAPGDVPATHVLVQGDYRSPREPVVPGVPSALDPNPAELVRPANPKTHGRRLTFARWIVSPDNPLTARVIANRVWQSHFGTGLVATPNDFGFAGAAPADPDLLDRLACELVDAGWSLKRLRRTIVTSAAYRQRAGSDAPSGDGTARPLRRLTAEQLRDALLAVSGLLTSKAGGPPVWPELPADVLQANPAFLDDNAERTKGWYPSPPAERNARSVFVIQKRTVRVPFLETFDLPENATSCGRRDVSTVPPQALSLLNSPLAAEAAAAFADRVAREAGDPPEARVRRAFALAVQREPTPQEAADCVTFLARRSLAELCRVLFNLNEFAYID